MRPGSFHAFAHERWRIFLAVIFVGVALRLQDLAVLTPVATMAECGEAIVVVALLAFARSLVLHRERHLPCSGRFLRAVLRALLRRGHDLLETVIFWRSARWPRHGRH